MIVIFVESLFIYYVGYWLEFNFLNIYVLIFVIFVGVFIKSLLVVVIIGIVVMVVLCLVGWVQSVRVYLI